MFKLRKIHKWLALIVGLQILLWGISGLYMTSVNIDFIHGDHLIKDTPPAFLSSNSISPIPYSTLSKFDPNDKSKSLTNISLRNIAGKPYYQLSGKRNRILIDAYTGVEPKGILKAEVLKQIELNYAGKDKLKSLELLMRYPGEIGGRQEKVWQAQFDDLLNSTLYFDNLTGRLISKRTDLWRTFDFLWMLHIMDYRTREDIENNTFRVFSVLSLVFTIVGWLLLCLRLKNPTKLSISLKEKKDRPSKWLLITRKIHRWLALFVSIQLFLWISGGVTFSFMDMREAGGNFIYKNTPKGVISIVIDHSRILESYPKTTRVEQYSQLGNTYSKIWFGSESVVLDQFFELVAYPREERIKRIAEKRYAGNGSILSIEKIIKHDNENHQFKLPHWRLTYSDQYNSRIYLSGDTGQFLATRTDAWKLYDFFMMVHFLDYFQRGDFNNGLAIFFALFLVLFSLSGVLLISQSFSKSDFLRVLNRIIFKKMVTLEVTQPDGKKEEYHIAKYELLFTALNHLKIKPKSKCGGAGECRQCWVRVIDENADEKKIVLSCQTVVVNKLSIKIK